MNSQISLFSPVRIGNVQLKNRVVMAPMTRNRAAEGNVAGELIRKYYTQRIGAGLIITEGSQISPQGAGYPGTPGIYSEAQITGWRKVVDSIHAADGRIFIQLWHVGRISHPSLQPNGTLPVAPSAVQPAGETVTYQGMQPFETPHALDLNEIQAIIEQYRQAAENAQAAGFDGAEIHAANGYLIDQFLRDKTNQRDDRYGGSIENRTRFLTAVVAAVVAAWAPGNIGVRLSPENTFNDIADSNPQATFNTACEKLGKYDLAYLHVLEGEMLQYGKQRLDYRQFIDYFGGPYMANNGYTNQTAQAAIDKHRADLVAFGVPFIANPDLVTRFQRNAPLNEPDRATFYGGNEHGYTDYPFLDAQQ